MRFLCILPPQTQPSGKNPAVFQFKINFYFICIGQSLTHLLGIIRNLLIINSQPGIENNVIHPMHRGTTEIKLFALLRQRSSRGPS